MAGISEKQLETWSHLGSVTQSKQTHETIRKVLNDSKSPYHLKSFKDFLQGSYANDTNIFGDSDVDIVMLLEDAFGHDTSQLPEEAKTQFDAEYSNATYRCDNWKKDVTDWLRNAYGSAVEPGNKAIYIKGDNNRRDADVLPCIRFKRYYQFNGRYNEKYTAGICFSLPDGTQIVNYPEQHRVNCETKNKDSKSMFKASVRILKNMRNVMISKKLIPDGLAPSYFLEGLLYNVPPDKFGQTYHNTMADSLNWLLQQSDKSKFVCCNEQYYLLHATSPVTWRADKCEQFLQATKTFWNDWGT